MSWDIYGNPLQRGHCEVHPHVHEEYPCSVCISEKAAHERQSGCDGNCESAHYLGQAQEHIQRLQSDLAGLREALDINLRPLILNAIGLLTIRRPVTPDVERVVLDLQKIIDGKPAPADPPSETWLGVAARAAQDGGGA